MKIGHRLALGFLGGAVGLATMEILRRATAPLVGKQSSNPTDVFLTERTMSPFGPQHEPGEGQTEALGRIIYERIVGDEPSPRMKTLLSWTVHLTFGLAVAALYGLVRSGKTEHVVRDGALFGTGLWVVGDELVAALLGLSDKPTAYPASVHVQTLAQHLGFGIATAATTAALEGWR